MKIVIASNNKNKIKEIKYKLSFNKKIKIFSLEDIGLHDNIPENGSTIEENSFQKAKYIFDKYNLNCFSDDTGLEVETLNNQPGVFTARYAGNNSSMEDNIKKLLNNMQGKDNRNARFRTIINLFINNINYNFEGIVEGKITDREIGEKGFGYDTVFVPKGYDITFAQMSLIEKNMISHRSIAIDKMLEFFKKLNL